MVEIFCTNNNQKKQVPSGTTLKDLAELLNIQLSYDILGATINNKVRNLNYELYTNKVVTYFDATDPSGYEMYERSLCFLLYKAVKDLFPQEDIVIKHSISGGKFCEFENPDFEVTASIVKDIRQYMQNLVKEDLPFIREEMLTEEAIELYRRNGMTDKVKLLQNRKLFYTSVYSLDKTINYFFLHFLQLVIC